MAQKRAKTLLHCDFYSFIRLPRDQPGIIKEKNEQDLIVIYGGHLKQLC